MTLLSRTPSLIPGHHRTLAQLHKQRPAVLDDSLVPVATCDRLKPLCKNR